MRIPCPFCGHRDMTEFVCRGEATPADAEDFERIYLRDNPRGLVEERWYHAYGCRRWLEVRRDTRSHAILGARLAQDAGR